MSDQIEKSNLIFPIHLHCLDIEQLQGKVNELLHENKLLQTQYDERKLHIQYVDLREIFP